MLRYGETVSESLMQKASDEVAKNLLTNLFREGQKGMLVYAEIPDINTIANDDTTAVGKILFNRDSSDTAASGKLNSIIHYKTLSNYIFIIIFLFFKKFISYTL